MKRLTGKIPEGYIVRGENLEWHCTGKNTKHKFRYYGEHIDKLGRYEDMQEQGRLLSSPVANEQVMYRVNINESSEPVETVVTEIHFVSVVKGEPPVISLVCTDVENGNKKFFCVESDIGESIYYTKEEAAAAIAKRNNATNEKNNIKINDMGGIELGNTKC